MKFLFSLVLTLFVSIIADGQRTTTTTTTNRVLLNSNPILYPNLFNTPNIQVLKQPDIERTVLTVVENPRTQVFKQPDVERTVLTVSNLPRDIPVIDAPIPTPRPRRRKLRPVTPAPVPTYNEDSFNDDGSNNTPYSFAYETDGSDGGAAMKRQESRGADGVVRGMYSYYDPDGIYRIVDYTADASGFNAKIRTNEPGTSRLDGYGASGRSNEANYYTDPANTVWEIEPPPAQVTEYWSSRRNRLSKRRV